MGWSAFVVFLTTIFLTLAFDLLYGVAVGMMLKFVFHLVQGARWKDLFKARAHVTIDGSQATLTLSGVAAFTNIYGIKKKFNLPVEVKTLNVYPESLYFTDHSFLHSFSVQQKKWEDKGIEVFVHGSFPKK